MTDQRATLVEIRELLREFVAERCWGEFHSPKNLAIALSVEGGELLENFQWLTTGDSSELGEKRLTQVRQELADVFICAIRLADRLDIDPIEAVLEKLEINRQKYPVHLVLGSAKKYTEY